MQPSTQLFDLAYNLRWAWHAPTRAFFRSLDPELWETVAHNPVALLRRIDSHRLEADDVTRRAAELHGELQRYLEAGNVWFDDDGYTPDRPLVAYFSAEFGLTECLRIYSGGLGVLAGDHLKSASDLGIPLTAVGMLYREGYFRQGLDGDGRQTHAFPAADFEDLPIRLVDRPDGYPLRVKLSYPGRQVTARVWRADVGRVPLFLLDTDVPENSDADRRLTARLYGGGHEMRITQEILLGMGGYRALGALGIDPETYHMNEGHSAFLALDLIRDIMRDEELDFEAASARARTRCVFTTHTPVPAGHDRFSRELVARYLTGTARALGLSLTELMELGRETPGTGAFTMTVLAIRLSRATNGVAALHGRVSREMWQGLWPERTVDDVPIDHITNGVHVPSWVHPDVAETFRVDTDRIGLAGEPAPDPDPERLWAVHQDRRRALVDYVARTTGVELDPEAMTIAFARRFATYKRATLVLGDLDRLDRILNHPERPAQILFSGKAHPADKGGQALIARIGEVARDPRFRGRVVFLPDYGIGVARELVQGADVWLNNPRRPMEASGTSGMKAAMNGVLNVSILDGWWDEAFRGRDPEAPAPGWAVGATGETALERTEKAADRADRADLYRVLEDEVLPLFYRRDDAGVPRSWTARMQQSIRQVVPFFNTHRMLRDYTDRYRGHGPQDAWA
jgi:starch phosphorylase